MMKIRGRGVVCVVTKKYTTYIIIYYKYIQYEYSILVRGLF